MSDQLDLFAARLGFPSMTDKDIRELSAATAKVFDLMRDGGWHTAQAIIDASGVREGLRRMRELRAHFTIEGMRVESSRREWRYRLAQRVHVPQKEAV